MQALGTSKAPDAFRTISEVADELDIPQHVLRFWETRFTAIRPLKRGGGRRYYRPDDVDLLRGIRQLLYGQGYTIKGVQRILKEEGPRVVQEIGRSGAMPVQRPDFGPADQDDRDYDEPTDQGSDETPAYVQASWPSASAASHRTTEAAGIAAAPAASPLAGNDLERLRAALTELFECQRVLAGLKRR